jgi:agmatinase
MSHGYESGRLNLPFVGISTFGKYPYQPDWSAIDADVAILGAPFDLGTQWRAGARFGPRSCARPRRSSPSATRAPTTTRTT